jgi:D-glycero-beta-D-manno-heptose-7-phosphate kinase
MKANTHLKQLIQKFSKIRVLVVGDLILDEYIWGNVSRISPEAPVPVVRVQTRTFLPGGALNVTHNMQALGAIPIPCGVVGSDDRGRLLIRLLKKKGIGTASILKDRSRPTTQKTRVIAHQQQVVRIDEENDSLIDGSMHAAVLREVKKRIQDVDCVIIEDYGKGLIDPRIIREVVLLARRKKLIMGVDPKEEHFEYYKGVTFLTPNLLETQNMAGFKIKDEPTLRKAGRVLLKKLRAEAVLVTRGEQGMTLFERDGKIHHIKTMAKEVYDVTGAGDTVIGVFTLALACGASLKESAILSNIAAGIVVGKVGVGVVGPQELIQGVEKIQ